MLISVQVYLEMTRASGGDGAWRGRSKNDLVVGMKDVPHIIGEVLAQDLICIENGWLVIVSICSWKRHKLNLCV